MPTMRLAMRSAASAMVLLAASLAPTATRAQNAAGWLGLELYANFETAGVTATISGDTNRNAGVSLQWRRVGEATFRAGQPLLRVDANHFVGSLFDLQAGSAYEIRATLADADGVSGVATQTANATTRADVLVEPSLRTLHVAPSGNDAHDGLTPATALRSIQRAADLAQPGDLVRVAPGLYHEAVGLPRSGSAAQPIVFRGQGAGVLLDGARVLPADATWAALGNGVYRTTLDFDTGHVVSEQGRLFRYASAGDLQAFAAGAPGGFFFEPGNRQLSVKFTDGSTPAVHVLHVADLGAGFTLDGRAFVRIEGFEFRNYGADEYGKGIYLRYSDDCIVRNNRFIDIGSSAVWAKGGSRNRIEDNQFSDTSIVSWPWPVTKASFAEKSSIALTDQIGRGNVIRRNHIDGSFDGLAPCGSQAPAPAFTNETDVYRNTFEHLNDDAIEADGYCANVRIFANRISDAHMGVSVAPAAPGPTWILRNVAWNLGNARTSQIDGYLSSFLKINSGYAQAVGPLLMYHNTIATSAPATEALYLLNPGASTSLTSRNNLYVASRDVWVKVNPVMVDADYDLLHTSDASRFVRWMGTPYADLVALRNATGLELNGVSAPPQLVAPASGDLRLLPTSPAIDHGLVLAGINDGYIGSAPDIGAFEFDDLVFASGFEG